MDEDLKMLQDFDNVDEFVNDVLKPVFPNLELSSNFMVSSADENATSFNGQLVSSKIFENTDYEYKGDGKFIHFTSLYGLKAILDNGYLRMSEFENLTDKSEFIYGARVFEENIIFDYKEEVLAEVKRNIFCLSACESNETTKRDSFMWEAYGDKGKGVIIEFEINKMKPYFFSLGKMQYGEESKKPLKKIKELSENYIEKKNKIFPNNFLDFLAELQSFHKPKIFENEQEVRLLLKENRHRKLESIYQDINSKQEVRKFNKLFLKVRHPFLDFKYDLSNDPDAVFNEFPQIEIKNIILGFDIAVENKVNITKLLQDIKTEHNYEYEVFQIGIEKNINKMR